VTAEFTLFLPCAAGVEDYLLAELRGLATTATADARGPVRLRGGVRVQGDWALVMRLNLWGRLAQHVLIELAHAPYRTEADVYDLAARVSWEQWFSPRETFRVDVTAHASPLKSLQFAALRVKDAVADRFRAKAGGMRPSVDTRQPDVSVRLHLTPTDATLYLDTSGAPLFKRGWRYDKGAAPLKETLAAALLAASGWWDPAACTVAAQPLYDPCCGSGTIVIEAAQLALGLAAGAQRHFAFERLRPHDRALWAAAREEAAAHDQRADRAEVRIFGSDVAHRMVDFAKHNARRAGVGDFVHLRGGDALQRLPPCDEPGVLLMNPPYGERIAVAGVAAAARARAGREGFAASGAMRLPEGGEDRGDEFFLRLAAHWKAHYDGWTAWLLTPDAGLPGRLRLKESRRVPLWNGPIECRLLRFDIRARRPRAGAAGEPSRT
jgi:putative N6-adenine-specific DNA methylase